jgi:hypothetical protein
VQWARQFALFLDYAVPTLVLDFNNASTGARRAVMWLHAAVALLIVLGAWRFHAHTKPCT